MAEWTEALGRNLHSAEDEIMQEREASRRRVRVIGVARCVLGLVLPGLVIAVWVSLWMPPRTLKLIGYK